MPSKDHFDGLDIVLWILQGIIYGLLFCNRSRHRIPLHERLVMKTGKWCCNCRHWVKHRLVELIALTLPNGTPHKYQRWQCVNCHHSFGEYRNAFRDKLISHGPIQRKNHESAR